MSLLHFSAVTGFSWPDCWSVLIHFFTGGVFHFLIAPIVPIAIVGGLCAVVFGFLGKKVGLPWLFWHDDSRKRFWSWFAFGLLLAHTAYIGYLLDVGRLPGAKHIVEVEKKITERQAKKWKEKLPTLLSIPLQQLDPVLNIFTEMDTKLMSKQLDERTFPQSILLNITNQFPFTKKPDEILDSDRDRRIYQAAELAKEHWLFRFFALPKQAPTTKPSEQVGTKKPATHSKPSPVHRLTSSHVVQLARKKFWLYKDIFAMGYVFYYVFVFFLVGFVALITTLFPSCWWQQLHQLQGHNKDIPTQNPETSSQRSMFWCVVGGLVAGGLILPFGLFYLFGDVVGPASHLRSTLRCVQSYSGTFAIFFAILWVMLVLVSRFSNKANSGFCGAIVHWLIYLSLFHTVVLASYKARHWLLPTLQSPCILYGALFLGILCLLTFCRTNLVPIKSPEQLSSLRKIMHWLYSTFLGSRHKWLFIVGMAFLMVFLVSYLLNLGNLHGFFEKLQLASVIYFVAAMIAWIIVLFVFLVLFMDPSGENTGPGTLLCVMLGLVMSLYGFASFALAYPTFTILVILLVLLLLAADQYKYPIKDFLVASNDLYNNRVSIESKLKNKFSGNHSSSHNPEPAGQEKPSAQPTSPENNHTTEPISLDLSPNTPSNKIPQWYGTNKPFQLPQRKPLILVCASGGGITAGVWTLGVLNELQKMIPTFRSSLRLVSGASGGMMGAAYYVATFHHDHQADSLDKCFDSQRLDFLSPVAQRLFLHDVWHSLFWPGKIQESRGECLQKAWSQHLPGTSWSEDAQNLFRNRYGHNPGGLDISFQQLSELEQSSQSGDLAPALIFSPMLVEDGRRLVISNLELSDILQHRILQPNGHTSTSCSGIQFWDLFGEEMKNDFRLSTAARLSASFPYVSEAAVLPTEPRRRVVDAGYFDNYGVNLLASWLRTYWSHIQQIVSKILVIQIDTEPREEALRFPWKVDPQMWAIGEDLTSPPEALLNMRDASMSHRNQQQLEQLSQGHQPFFSTIHIPLVYNNTSGKTSVRSNHAPLSWYLTKQDVLDIKKALRGGDLQTQIHQIKTWLGE